MTTFDLLPLGQNINVLFAANTILGFCLIGFINAIVMALVAYRYFQAIQQCGYVDYEYKKWLLRRDNSHITRLAMLSELSLLGFMLTNMAFMVFNAWWVSYCGFGLYAIFLFIYLSAEAKKKNKLPLVFTKRLVRLLITFMLLTIVLSVLLIFAVNGIALISSNNYLILNFRYAILCLFPVLTPFIVLLAYYINRPFENAINKKYVNAATSKLKGYDNLIKIGITGSYGKTTVKEVLKAMLSVKYKVMATPESYNTPLGISKSVNKLDDSYDVFIAEMGARRTGDIKELTLMVNPSIAVITGVTGQHLETFLTIGNVKRTKYELIENMQSGKGYFSSDNKYTLEMYEKCPFEKHLAGITSENALVYADNVIVNEEGTTFTLNYNGESVECKTALYGKHNVQDICLAAAVAVGLGVSLTEICSVISSLKPIKHRLELIVNDNGVRILDDGYNANVEGVKRALEVLKEFSGKKVVITPGIVELGLFEDEHNYLFGEDLASVCDYVMLVGRGSALRIREGLLNKGFNADNIIMVKDLSGATEKLPTLISSGDTVLFINDLPDKYN